MVVGQLGRALAIGVVERFLPLLDSYYDEHRALLCRLLVDWPKVTYGQFRLEIPSQKVLKSPVTLTPATIIGWVEVPSGFTGLLAGCERTRTLSR